MKKIYILLSVLLVSGCTGRDNGGPLDQFDQTAPGYPLPIMDGIQFMPCRGTNEVGQCIKWIYESDRCVNPKGHDASPPIIACASIKRK